MAHTGMEAKDTTLFDVVQELEEEMTNLMQALEITPTTTLEEKAVETAQGRTERKVLAMIRRLQALKHQMVESTRLVNRVVGAIGE